MSAARQQNCSGKRHAASCGSGLVAETLCLQLMKAEEMKSCSKHWTALVCVPCATTLVHPRAMVLLPPSPGCPVMQARETLKLALQTQIQQKQAALDQLRQQAANTKAKLLAITRKLAAVGSDVAESVPKQLPQAAAAPMDEG